MLRMSVGKLSVCAIAFILLCAYPGVYSAPQDHLVTSLPGLANFPTSYKQYAGYIPTGTKGDNLFYWFVESSRNPAQDPLVIWLTGGPGCSSLYAFFTEHGPFHPINNGSALTENPYSWNQYANIIYVESPAGVGFSYSSSGNYTTGDTQVALDNYNFLLDFLSFYPEYASHPIYVAGESYAGHYVPEMARLILQGNMNGAHALKLAGTLSGNPLTDNFVDGNNKLPFMYYHGLVGQRTFASASKACNGTFAPKSGQPLSSECKSELAAITASWADINPYNIYANCTGRPSVGGACFTANAAAELQPIRSFGQVKNGRRIRPMSQTYVPCIDTNPTVNYLNNPEVQKAIHVAPQSIQPWDVCSQVLNYTGYSGSQIPTYQMLLDSIRVLVYSGDADTCIPYLGTQTWTNELGLPEMYSFKEWMVDDQVAGYQVGYKTTGGGLYYATVKGAGHMVPTYKPAQALALFQKFIDNQPF